jgi:hypothetical protein
MTVTALTRHDLRNEHVVLDLLLDDEEDQHEQDLLQRDGRRHGERGNGGQDRPDEGDELADA